ncbi:MAG TPA: glycerophosphodiester phosphodiesterase [Jatrophihabitantaceae bacterium]|nr:glycerophosphodiester phosphodiesterase [Jatrophihabitantaceae bacterium]
MELAEVGARVFEVDVQLSGDSVVVSHFLPVLRVRGWLENDNWKVRWVGRGPCPDPELDEVADRIPADCEILLDPKEKTPERRAKLADRLISHGLDTSRCYVSTAHDRDLARYRDAGFRTWRTAGNPRELARVLGGGARPDHAVSVRHTLLSDATVTRLHDVVPTVVAWTVNNVGRARRLRGMGVDGLTTDLREVMAYAAA